MAQRFDKTLRTRLGRADGGLDYQKMGRPVCCLGRDGCALLFG